MTEKRDAGRVERGGGGAGGADRDQPAAGEARNYLIRETFQYARNGFAITLDDEQGNTRVVHLTITATGAEAEDTSQGLS